jgi:uncharacterized protein
MKEMEVSRPSPDRRQAVLDRLSDMGGVVVALSGGVDSAVLLALAVEALGPLRVVAATGSSPAVPAADLEDAHRVAAFLGVRHRIVETHEIDRADYRANDGTRCYHCRDELFGRLRAVAEELGLAHIAYGAIADDLADDRPGMAAARRHEIAAPLLEAGLDKASVRQIARSLGLPVDAKPAAACLASRLPTGTEVTPERLRQIERAETVLRDLGFVQVRVRHHGDVARIEVDPEGRELIARPDVRAAVAAGVRGVGFRFVALDLDGYRPGSLNLVSDPGAPTPTAPKRAGGQ